MTDYRIVCTEQTNCQRGGHIVGVGTGGDQGWDRRWTVAQVWAAMRNGDQFYTFGGGKWARVEAYNCGCQQGSLRSTADATLANNLDRLNLCRI